MTDPIRLVGLLGGLLLASVGVWLGAREQRCNACRKPYAIFAYHRCWSHRIRG